MIGLSTVSNLTSFVTLDGLSPYFSKVAAEKKSQLILFVWLISNYERKCALIYCPSYYSWKEVAFVFEQNVTNELLIEKA